MIRSIVDATGYKIDIAAVAGFSRSKATRSSSAARRLEGNARQARRQEVKFSTTRKYYKSRPSL